MPSVALIREECTDLPRRAHLPDADLHVGPVGRGTDAGCGGSDIGSC